MRLFWGAEKGILAPARCFVTARRLVMPPAITRGQSHYDAGSLRAGTGHTEAVRVVWNNRAGAASAIAQSLFWELPRPHPGHGQGPLDTGSQYRSAIVTRKTRPAQTSPQAGRPPTTRASFTAQVWRNHHGRFVGGFAPASLPKPITSNTWRWPGKPPLLLRPAQPECGSRLSSSAFPAGGSEVSGKQYDWSVAALRAAQL